MRREYKLTIQTLKEREKELVLLFTNLNTQDILPTPPKGLSGRALIVGRSSTGCASPILLQVGLMAKLSLTLPAWLGQEQTTTPRAIIGNCT